MSALEKFKRRLVRDIARRQYVESQPEDEMWDQLKTEYGCDCFLLWQHMKVLTSKKLKRLLAADDRVERITRVARMTSTDWLTFDLVLVHQDVDVIGEELIQSGKPESQVLQLLLDLVIMYCIEDCSGDRLVWKWAALTRAYNSGGRECSAMLLQRRWYQLKDLSRRRVYEFWKQYRGNSRNLPKAVRPTKLQIQISESLPYLITERFLQWKELLESGKIIQAVQFENRRRKMESNDDPDLVVIEPHVETIELGADSEDDEVKSINEIVIDSTEESITEMIDDSQFEQNTFNNAENSPESIDNDTSDSIIKDNDLKAPVKTEPTEVLELIDTLSDDEVIEIDNFGNIEEKFEPEHVENDCKYSENDILLPKITNVMGNVDIESNDKYNSISHITNNEVLSYEDAPTVSDIASSINPEDSNKTFEESVKENPPFNADDVMDISELPSTLEFVDDGIEFVDDDVDTLEGKVDIDDGNKIVNLDDVDPSYAIDRKLVMIPITYTKKLEDMKVLKNFSYSSVKGDHLIELIESESKIIKTEVKTDYEDTEETTIEDSGMTRGNGEIDISKSQDNSQMNNVTNIETDVSKYAIKVKAEKVDKSEDDLEKCEIPRVKYTSWLLQKPKHRQYNPILLCKNPDFNTRLKRLGVGFFLSERNRQFINACKPLTVDMHKAFETKLVNNVLYLEKATTPHIKEEKVAEVCENTASVIPSAVPVQSLLDMTRVEQKDLLPQKTQIDESKSSPDHRHEDDRVIERGHVINEPLMSTMDRAKERLITKEKTTIAPTPVSNTRRPAEIIGAALSTLPPPTNNKRNKTKPKPPAPAPSWTNYGTVIEYEESLITKDTLNKVLYFLDTGIFQTPRKGGATTSEAIKKPTTKGAIPPSPSTNETSAQDKVKSLKSTSDNDEFNWNNTSQNSKRRRNNPHSITPQSGYCCWARNKIDYLRTENKNINSIKAKQYRHLCPVGESGCICCCRQNLLETMVSKKLKLDHTYSRESDLPEPQDPIELRDIAIQARLIRNESGQMEIKSTIELYHPQSTNLSRNEQGTIALDEITKNSNDSTTNSLAAYTALPSSGSKQSVNNDDAKKFAHASSNTSDFLLTDNESPHVETPPIIKTNVIPALPHRGNRAELFSVTAEAGRQLTPRSIVDKNNAQQVEDEVISLIDEEESAPPNQTSSSAPKQLLPKGVNILLLPDKTLSVSIEPGVQIDPVNLSKLPEILSAVQSKLLQPGVLNKYKRFPIRRWKYPSGNQTASRNTLNNDPTIVNMDPQKNTVSDNPKVNAVNPVLNDIQETAEPNNLNRDVNITEDNAELVVMDSGLQVSKKSVEINSMTPEVNFPKENSEVVVPQQNADLVANDPILPAEKGQAEHNMSPELHSSEENAELIAIDQKVPVTEENYDLVVNSKIDIVDKNAELTVINVNARNCELNVINNELITTAENAVNDNSVILAPQASVNFINDQLNASEENTYLNTITNSNTDTNFTIAETTPMLYVDSLEPTVENTTKNVTKDDEDKLIYTDYIVKVKPPDTSRKTLLSDLMTMSGISPEDAHTPTEPPAANVINYNLQDDPYYLSNTYSVGGNIQIGPPQKKVKKVMVFIKKRSKAKPLLNESVIDLTEDNDNSAETSQQNDPQTDDSPKKENEGNKILNLKRAKLVRVPAAAVPHKIYQAAQSLLRKDNTFPVQDETTVSSREIETQMKIHLARHYRKLNKKPTILDILKNIKHSKEMQTTKQSRKQSESSDDEPLAKKSRRMRTENTEDNVSLTVIPVDQYNVPVECNSNEPVMFVPATSKVQDADTENADDQEADIDADTQNIDDQGDDTNTDDDEGSILGI